MRPAQIYLMEVVREVGADWLEKRMNTWSLAEAVRFELTEGVNPRRFSRPVP